MLQCTWREVAEQVRKVNPEIYEIIESTDPNTDLPFYLAEYPYGQVISDTQYNYYPDGKGGYRLDTNPLPLTLILENSVELFIETEGYVIPETIMSAGAFFPLRYASRPEIKYIYHESNIFVLTAGVRNCLMLQLYGANANYEKLKKYYALPKELRPENLSDHCKIFSEIARKEHSPWRAKVLFFDHRWYDIITNDLRWHQFKMYVLRKAVGVMYFQASFKTFSLTLKLINKKHGLAPKEYTFEMLLQAFQIALNEMPSYVPSTSEVGLPRSLLARTFDANYGTAYAPVIFESRMDGCNRFPSFLSLTHNRAAIAETKTFRPLVYLEEVRACMDVYMSEMATDILTKGSTFEDMPGRLKLEYFSERGSKASPQIQASENLQYDPRIIQTHPELNEGRTFPERAPFAKALVSVLFQDR